MTGLTTHILDLAHGAPAGGVTIVLHKADKTGGFVKIAKSVTNDDGRCPAPLIDGAAMAAGRYRLDFHIGDYFRRRGVALEDPAFLDIVEIAFAISDTAAHYHVPLLVSPYGYSTYRGS